MHWLEAAHRFVREGKPHVLVTVVSVEGSAPRAAGTKMVVSTDSTAGSVGGGNLEFQAIARARALLAQNQGSVEQHRYSLGNDLSQCCGGRVSLMFEVFVRPTLDVVLFGAGHVGQALASILKDIDCRLNWFDSRPAFVPVQVNALNTTAHLVNNPYHAVESCAAGSSFLVMTHSHNSDFELIEAILSRSDIAFCGLIASKSKATSFRNRLRRKGYTDQELSRLVAPVGSTTGEHKEPMAVAVSIVAQLLEFSASLRVHEPQSAEASPG